MGVEVFEYNGAKVRVAARGDGGYKVYWREAHREKSTTIADHKKAVKRANQEARRLGSGQGGRMLSVEEAELVKLVKEHAGTRSPFAWVKEMAAAEDELKKQASISQAVAYYRDAGMLTVERVSLKRARDRFLAEYDRSPHDTRAAMRKTMDMLLAKVPGLDVLDLTAELLTGVCSSREDGKGHVEAKTFNNRLGYFKTFLNRCRQWKYLPKGTETVAELIKPRKEKDPIPEIWEPETVEAALKALPGYLVPTFVVGNFMGPRPRAELRRIEWESFDWQRSYLEITTAVARKTARHRFVPIPANVKKMLKPWRDAGATGRISGRGHMEAISKFLRKEGIIKRWPSDVMRHSYISYQLAMGHGYGQVAEWAGTSEKKIRRNYRRPLRKEDGKRWWSIVVMREHESTAERLRVGGFMTAEWVQRKA